MSIVTLKKLFAMLGSEILGERENARAKLAELLAKNKKTWNDLTELLQTGDAQGWQDDDGIATSGGQRPAPLDRICRLLEKHLHLTLAQHIAMTLWIAHSFIYSKFSVSPRLALVSPVRGCGKTTALNLTQALAFNARKIDHTTAAVFFRLIDRERPCILLDEVDNQDLPLNAALRSVLNSGHLCNGKVERYLDGEVATFSTFAPMALATIGILPLPFVARQSGWKRCGEQDGQFGGRDERDDCRAATVTQAIFS
jgi:hypothetical protein